MDELEAVEEAQQALDEHVKVYGEKCTAPRVFLHAETLRALLARAMRPHD
jgi:predicted RNase H-like HicB family nuclease